MSQEKISNPNFTETVDTIKSALSIIDNGKSKLDEKQEILDKLVNNVSKLQSNIADTENKYATLNSSMNDNIEKFKNTLPKTLNSIEQNHTDLEKQLQMLEDEKKNLIQQANQLTSEFKQIQQNIQKMSNQNIPQKEQLYSSIINVDDEELESIKAESNEILEKLSKITQKITNSQNSIFQYSAAAIQTHSLFLKEIEIECRIQKQINEQNFILSHMLDSQKNAIQEVKNEKEFAEKDKHHLSDQIQSISFYIEQYKKNDVKYDNKLEKALWLIESLKRDILCKKNEIKDVDSTSETFQRKMDKHRKEEDKYINEKKEQIQIIHHSLSNIQYQIRNQKRVLSKHHLAKQNLKLLLANIDKDRKDEEKIQLNHKDAFKKLDLKEQAIDDKNRHIEHEMSQMRIVLDGIYNNIAEQKRLYILLKNKKPDPMPVIDTPRKIISNITDNVETIRKDIEMTKRAISHETLKKEFYEKKKLALLGKLTNKINENRRLKKRIKEIQDSRYLMSCTVKINDTIPFASLMHEIDEYTIRNENRRRKIKRKEKNLLKVLSENGMKLIDGKYIQISNPSFHNDQLSNREKSLIQFIERSQNISAKVDEIKQKLDLKLSPIIYKSLLTEWSEFIDKQISYMT